MILGYSPSNDRQIMRRIRDLNSSLNAFDYGVALNGKTVTDDNGIEQAFRNNLYRTLSCKDFLRHRIGVCWDYADYEARYFQKKLGFGIVSNGWLRFDRTFSLYYMEAYDLDNTMPITHTWLAFQLGGHIYSFESSWKACAGVTRFEDEESMIWDFVERQDRFYYDQGIRLCEISVYKYLPMGRGLDGTQFCEQAKADRDDLLGIIMWRD